MMADPHSLVEGCIITSYAIRANFCAIYVRGGRIEAVRRASDPAPDGFAEAKRVKTGGTIYPGLVDLHNHLAYNAMPPWPLAKRYDDRSQWRRAKDYAARVGIMVSLKSGDAARSLSPQGRYCQLRGGSESTMTCVEV